MTLDRAPPGWPTRLEPAPHPPPEPAKQNKRQKCKTQNSTKRRRAEHKRGQYFCGQISTRKSIDPVTGFFIIVQINRTIESHCKSAIWGLYYRAPIYLHTRGNGYKTSVTGLIRWERGGGGLSILHNLETIGPYKQTLLKMNWINQAGLVGRAETCDL